MARFRKSSSSSHHEPGGRHRFEHWYRDNTVYFITARCRDKYPAFQSEEAKTIFWERFYHWTGHFGFIPWITTLLHNHYYTLGYLKVGENLGPMMRNIHGSVAKLVNDILPERRLPFWRTVGKRDYFDGCIRDEHQCDAAYRYTYNQAKRAGLVRDVKLYPHTHVKIEFPRGLKRAIELDAFLPEVPYKRYEKSHSHSLVTKVTQSGGGTTTTIPMKRILLVVLIAFLAQVSSSHAASRWDEMDYGPFLSSSVTMFKAEPEKPEGITLKGITVKLDGGKAAVCFDSDMLRYSAGWDGGWLKLMGTPFDGTHRPPEGSRPAPNGKAIFVSDKVPGWENDGHGEDPRKSPYGPIPSAWGKYKGLYVNSDRIVFSYVIQGCDVLDMPGIVRQGERVWITRTLRIAPSDKVLQIAGPGGKGPVMIQEEQLQERFSDGSLCEVVGAPKGSQWKLADRRLFFEVPAHATGVVLRMNYTFLGNELQGHSPHAPESKLEDPQGFIKGGPSRWAQTIETRGKLGSGDAPFVVDTLTLPDNNPWHSWMRIGGFDFFPDGKSAAISTWSGDVWVVTGIDDKLEHLKWKRFASGLFQPLGLKIIDGVIHVLGRDQITRLKDLNNDGEADFYENFNNDVEVTPNFHEFAFELNNDPQGNLYFTKGAPLLGTLYFDPIGKHNGCMMKVSKDGSKLDVFGTGLRAPNGSSVSPEGLVTCSDNQGIWTPTSRINLVKEGGFYGCMGTHHRDPAPTTYDVPLCWIPWGLDNSSGGQAWVTSDNWGLPKGSLVHLSYGKCKLFQVLWEQNAAGVPQGGVVKFPLNFATGTMRAKFNPTDGQLYVAGLKGWQTDGQQDGALQRVRYTTKPVYTITAAKVTHDGIDLTFSQPLKSESAVDLENYAVERWNYLWSKDYGSPEFKVSKPSEQGHDPVEVKGATLSADGRTLSLKLADMKPVMQMMVKLNVEAKDGKPIELEYFGTINWVP